MHPRIKAAFKKVPGVIPLVVFRNELRARYRFARKRMAAPPEIRGSYDLVRRLFQDGQNSIALPTKDFLTALDRAKLEFSRAARHDPALKLQVVKALNLLVSKHEYLNYSVMKVGRPSGFMLDTANACQLGCATCQHSSNKEWTAKTFVPMPVGTMKPDTFDAFIGAVGLHCYAGHFYNNSEPFLNKRTPHYLRAANLYRIQTMISSNMSIPKLDAEAIVNSGLDLLMTAIDGTTQAVYEKYRRGGHLEIVLGNVRDIVAAKKRLKSATPELRWQFLTFQHNVHQIDDAIELAREMGYDSFNVATPYDVSADDPSIQVATYPKVTTNVVFNELAPELWKQDLGPIVPEIEKAFSASFVERYEKLGSAQPATKPSQGYCDWLHLGVISDALGRIHPCCLPDYKEHGSFVFGNVKDDGVGIFNNENYQQARLLFANEPAYQTRKLHGREKRSKCESCAFRPQPQIGLGAIDVYLQTRTNEPYQACFNDPRLRRLLSGWSRHNEVYNG